MIEAVREGKEFVKIWLEEWKYFREGSDHLLLLNSNEHSQHYDYVLILEREKEESHMEQKLNEKYL